MTQPIIYHNPRCSKSRQTLALLEERGFAPEIIEYLQAPPTPQALKSLLKQLGCGARDIIRTKEKAFTEHNLSDPNLTEDQLIDAIYHAPILLERPIVVFNNKAAIGRPPENVLEIL